jgi:hypothetical protein
MMGFAFDATPIIAGHRRLSRNLCVYAHTTFNFQDGNDLFADQQAVDESADLALSPPVDQLALHASMRELHPAATRWAGARVDAVALSRSWSW